LRPDRLAPPLPPAAPPAAPGVRGGARGAALLLAAFWVVLAASLTHKSLTYDEVAHAAAGYSYWHFGDYRLQPENGVLPQRVAGLPLELSVAPFPPPDPSAWRDAAQWQLGGQWLYASGHDAAALGEAGRMGCALFAVALGALVWAWSRRLFGTAGALVTLLLFVLCPTVLANGALMTSDMAAAFFLAAATGAVWALLQRVAPMRALGCALVLAALFLTKASALLMVPVVLVLAVARVADGRPLPVAAGRRRWEWAGRGRQALGLAAVWILQGALVAALLWAAYGFRYSAFAPGAEGRFRLPWPSLLAQPPPAQLLRALRLDPDQQARAGAILAAHGAAADRWTNAAVDAVEEIERAVLSPEQVRRLGAGEAAAPAEAWARVVASLRDHRLLPEAWLYGVADVLRRAQVRPAFLNGDFRLQGWTGFFPYTFLVKTPLEILALLVLAAGAVRWRWPRAGDRRLRAAWASLYPVLPLWTLIAVYGAAALASHLNIGHRHLLPLYGPLFILCGILGRAWARPSGRAVVAVLLAALAGEAVATFPDYLAYFNGIVTPRHAYRHLVDSSLDWGQDLPAVRNYLDRHHPDSAYLSYFGAASPGYYGIGARLLYSVGSNDALAKPDWKEITFAPGDEDTRVPELRRQWPAYDLLGVERLGTVDVAVLLKQPGELRLGPGTYLVSASMLQPVNFELSGPWGPWNARYEETYQRTRVAVAPLESGDRDRRQAALMGRPAGEWPVLLAQFEAYRFGRLTAFLREREPDDEIHSSVLVYRVSAADLTRFLDGPPPPYGPDDLAASEAALGGRPGN